MISAKRATIICKDNGELEVKCIKPIKIINWHERNKQLIGLEIMARHGKAVKLKENNRIHRKTLQTPNLHEQGSLIKHTR